MIADRTTPVITQGMRFVPGLRRVERRSGFALLITITLLAFLVLLLVSLASLTRVETQVASNNQQFSQARQNALMALNIALGELQKYTGPDQRTTARADLDAPLANVTTANGRWIGAYGNGAPVDTTYTLKPSLIPANITANSNSKGSQAKLLNWLVSGNENTAFDPSATTTVATDGHIVTAPASIAWTPASTINLATASSTPAAADTQALLVGPMSASAQSDYVAAPLVTINAAAGTVPGLTTAAPIGRYAWWAGDEGAKARVNLPMASAAQAADAFVSAQRAAIELVDGKNPTGSTNATDLIGTAAYDPALTTALSKLVSPGQLSMLTPTAATELPAALRLRFHDLTAASTSVLADTYAGGLKKDLSAVLATGTGVTGSPLNTDYLFTPDNDDPNDSFGVPTWALLRSFAQKTTPATGLEARLPTPTDVGISPVLTYLGMGMQYVAPNGLADDSAIKLALFPITVLWNPYNAVLKGRLYEVGMRSAFGSPYNRFQLQVETGIPATPWKVKETLDFSRGAARYNQGTANTFIRFIVDVPDMQPGESLVFTMHGTGNYNPLSGGIAANTLEPGIEPSGHVLIDNGVKIGIGEGTKQFRVAGSGMLNPAPGSLTFSGDPEKAWGMGGGGGVAAYLGNVRATKAAGLIPPQPNVYEWYQSVTNLTTSGDGTNKSPVTNRNNHLQGPAPLPVAATNTASFFVFQKFFGEYPLSAIYPAVRWIAQNNPRANMVAPSHNTLNATNMMGRLGIEGKWMNFKSDSTDTHASSGMGLDASGAAGDAIVNTTLFEFRQPTQPLLTPGQLQHANVSLLSSYPAYPIGNSLGDFVFLNNRDKVRLAMTITTFLNGPADKTTSYYDVSWLLNRVLWDRYFVSTVPHPGTGTDADAAVTAATDVPEVLPNPRHVKYGAAAAVDLHDADKAAANLLLKGGFNINSTSEQAWRAVLGGINRLAYDPVNVNTPGSLPAALPRFAKPVAQPAVDTSTAWAWKGYRYLTDVQIDQLAKNIVAGIRDRGPFVSLADFVNRRLVDNPASATNEQFSGILQAAIDATFTGTAAANRGEDTAYGPADSNPFHGPTVAAAQPNYVNARYDSDLMKGYSGVFDPDKASGSPSAFAPQFLTQGDVLSAIGAGLTARSDTFTIRTYGEAVNPVTQDIQGRAWCEAVVQRLPEYVDALTDTDAHSAPTASINKIMGRRYKIISFRWLSSNDI